MWRAQELTFTFARPAASCAGMSASPPPEILSPVELAELRERLLAAARSGDDARFSAALSDLMARLQSETVQSHIRVVRWRCGADAALAVSICNALCEASAGLLQKQMLAIAARSS
jgi:hypothetical protein